MYSGVEPSTGPSVIMPTNLGGHVLRRLGSDRRRASRSKTSTWSSGKSLMRWISSSRFAVTNPA